MKIWEKQSSYAKGYGGQENKNCPTKLWQNAGFTLVEVIVALSIFTLTIIGIVSVYGYSIKNAVSNTKKMQANFLIEEGLEIIKSIRDQGWSSNISSITTNTDNYFYFDGAVWRVSTTTPEIIDNTFNRKFLLGNVYRDQNYDIADSGVLDPDARRATVSVFWEKAGVVENKSVSTIITNIFSD